MNSVNHGEQSQINEEPPEAPFGEDITNPDSRTMPPEFHGEWVWDLSECHASGSETRKVISRDRIVTGDDVERVVAVRFIATGIAPEFTLRVAVVTLPAEVDQKQQYSLFYFGLSEDGNSLVDLESMDWVLHRCPAKAR